jgi:hypothetical protein
MLKWLGLSNNQLEGEIPSELGKCIMLKRLGLSNNQLEGGIPGELGNCTKLEKLFLQGNKLRGEIPSELGKCIMVEDQYGKGKDQLGASNIMKALAAAKTRKKMKGGSLMCPVYMIVAWSLEFLLWIAELIRNFLHIPVARSLQKWSEKVSWKQQTKSRLLTLALQTIITRI